MRYPMSLRIRPLVSLVGLAFFLYLGGTGAADAWAHDQLVGALAICVLTSAIVILCIHNTRASWFFLHRYCYHEEESLQEIGVFGKRTCIRLPDVCAKYDFRVLGNIPDRWRRGHVLLAHDGRRVHLTEALPIWDEIARHISDAATRQQPILWRWVL